MAMTLIFCDGFDHYTTLANKYDEVGTVTGAICYVDTTGGRQGTGALRFTQVISTTQVRKNVTITDGYVIGFAFKFTPTNVYERGLLKLRDGTSSQVTLTLSQDGYIRAYRGSQTTGTLIATATIPLVGNQWSYIDVALLIANAGGLKVRINTVSAIDFSGDTMSTLVAQATQLEIGDSENASVITDHRYDDLYVCTSDDPLNDTPWGDVRVEELLPTSDGTYAEFTCSAGVDHYANVNENPPNDDTDYNYSSTLNHRDTFGFPDAAAAAGTVYAAVVNMDVRKVESGSRGIKAMARHGGTDGLSDESMIGDAYHIYQGFFPLNPSTSAAWTIAEVNAAEFGIKITT